MSVYRVPATDSKAPQRIGEFLRRLLGYSVNPITIVCIGTDRSTGDCLGPLVGTMLCGVRHNGVFKVLGTLDEPVHAANLLRRMEDIKGEGPVLALDACLGNPSQVGIVSIGPGPLRPGAGLHKSLPAVGDVFITGTVNVAGFADFLVLQNTRLSLVVKMARAIAAGICECFNISWESALQLF